MKIIVTEKPSVAREYAKVLNISDGKKDGYIESGDWIITWCVGHLVTLCYPHEYDPSLQKWSLDTLPFLPETYKYHVIEDVSKQFNIIKGLYNRQDIETIYYAGDSGREGIYIQALVRQMAGHKQGIKELVVWIDSQTEAEIKRGLREAKPISAYQKLIDSGYMRAIEDFATGINFSRALSLKYGNFVKNASGNNKAVIAVGRVMSCVLALIVEREREIIHFQSTDFFRIVSSIHTENGLEIHAGWKVTENSSVYNSPLLYNETGFLKESDAQAFIQSLPPTVKIEKNEKKIEKKYAPLLFNLAELQSECSRIFKISPDQTLQIAQTLYEKKMISYPRTDSRFLTTAVAGVIEKTVLQPYQSHPVYGTFASRILKNGWHAGFSSSKYVNDSKVTDHYALIPTGEGFSNEGSLSPMEKNLYDLIVRRFLSVFFPPAEYYKVQLTESAGREIFTANGTALKAPGYYEVAGLPEEDEDSKKKAQALASIKEGTSFSVTYNTAKGQTVPPKRYTSGSIILAMENAGQLIEDEELRAQIKTCGIGTSATRAETVKKLVNLNYINLNNKTQVLTPSDMGNMIYEIIKTTVPSVLSPKMTASWEKGLEGVANGSIEKETYLSTLNNFVFKEVNAIKEEDKGNDIAEQIKPYANNHPVSNNPVRGGSNAIGKCPFCGGNVVDKKKGFGCSKWQETGCSFFVGNISGKEISLTQIKKLIEKGETDLIKGFKKKNGDGTFDAKLKVNQAQKKIEFSFPNRK